MTRTPIQATDVVEALRSGLTDGLPHLSCTSTSATRSIT